MYSAWLSFVQKISVAVSFMAAGLMLKLIGVDAQQSIQATDTIFWIRVSFVLIAAVPMVAVLFLLRRYNLDEDKATAIRATLELRRGYI